jgi:hypothetical protein
MRAAWPAHKIVIYFITSVIFLGYKLYSFIWRKTLHSIPKNSLLDKIFVLALC